MRINRSMDVVLLLLRVMFGGGMLYAHGWPKLMRLLGDDPISFSDPFGVGPAASLGLAVFAEFLCSLLIIFGLFTRWAAIPLIITMVVAVFYVHVGDPFSKMEKGLMYLVPFICLLVAGGGWYSLDAQIRKV